jgi:hypothetical protein
MPGVVAHSVTSRFLFVTQDRWFNSPRQNLVMPLVTDPKFDPFGRFQEERCRSAGPRLVTPGRFH